MNIRPAIPADAQEISRVLCSSIRELCAPDHRGEAEVLARWCANKTPQAVSDWLQNPQVRLFVAEEDGGVMCVGAVSSEGEILLNYVAPEARWRGASKAMLTWLEGELASAGFSEGRLNSTKTAYRFYRAAGWNEVGPASEDFGLSCQPMAKQLDSASS